MKEAEIEQLVESALIKFESITEAQWENKPSPSRWSRKEELGHLVDSAQNNLRRLIVTQYQPNDRIVYHQNEWVASQGYQQADLQEIIQLWVLLNRQLARVAQNMPAEKWRLTCNTGKNQPEQHSLQFLLEDYVRHLRHHLLQIEQL